MTKMKQTKKEKKGFITRSAQLGEHPSAEGGVGQTNYQSL